MQRKMVYSGLGRSRKLRAHRRQLSDPKIHMDIHPIKEDGGSENEYGRVSCMYILVFYMLFENNTTSILFFFLNMCSKIVR